MPVDVIVRTSLAMNSTFFPDGPWPPGGLGQLFEIGLTSTVGIAGCGGTPPSSAFTVAGRDSSSSSRSDETIATRCRSCSSSNLCAAAVQAAAAAVRACAQPEAAAPAIHVHIVSYTKCTKL
jgi:hypothetical protein